jgi:hypothetical protein
MQKKFRQRWKTFVKTNDGRNLWFLHKQGYKFCEYLEDLTYEQEAFLILSNNLEVDESEQEMSENRNDKKNNSSRDLVQNKIKNKLK